MPGSIDHIALLRQQEPIKLTSSLSPSEYNLLRFRFSDQAEHASAIKAVQPVSIQVGTDPGWSDWSHRTPSGAHTPNPFVFS